MADDQANVTQLLRAAGSGDRRDLDALLEAIYDDLRRIAMKQMRAEPADHTLQPTALVHEAYMRLVDQRSTDWNDRLHFFSIASRVIRRILVDHARARRAEKRGGGERPMTICGVEPASRKPDVDLLALDDALKELHEINEQQAQVVELRFFGGLTLDEIAEALSIGRRTVDRDWSVARAWLYTQIRGAEQPTGD